MKIRVYLCSIFLLLSPALARTQQNVTSGTLSGRIEDASGASVSGASVTATHLETNQQLTTGSDHDGRFRFPYLRTGSYEIKIDAEGFTALTRQLTVTVGQAIDLPVKLDVAGVSAQVNIGSDMPIVETVRTQIT